MSWLGFFYGGNIAGAVLGSLLAGFYLLRVYDMAIATYVAVALNVVVALGRLWPSRSATPRTTPRGRRRRRRPARPGRRAVYVAIALSGMTALAAEVVWTRLLSLLFGATVYTFSLILAVFLVGLGIGSSLGAAMARGASRARAWRSAGASCCSAARSRGRRYMLTQSLPYWPINPSISTDPWFNFQLDLVRCLWVVLPAAILWGASFPLALAVGRGARPGSRPARRRRLRGQHGRRDRRLARRQPAARLRGSAASTRSRC